MDTGPRRDDADGPADAPQRACSRLAAFVLRNRVAVLVASAVAFVALAVAALQLRIAPDWAEPFLPKSDARLMSYADALHRFGHTEALYVDVSAPDAATLHTAADAAESQMRASGLFTRVTGRSTAQDLRRTADAIGAALPALLDDDGLGRLEARTHADAIAERMEEQYERLLGPLGGWYQLVLARDPLELTAMVIEHADGSGAGAGAHVERGRIVSGDGRHALIVAVAAASVGDEAGGAAIASSFAGLEEDARSRGAEIVWVGGHRHYLANAQTMQRDLKWVSVAAGVLVLGVIFVGFRGARIAWISGLAVIVGSVAGAAALRIVYGECSGIALGIGAALSGISVDYVVHLHAARRQGERRGDAVRRVFATVGPSVVIGAATSAAGFLILLASDVPAHGQLGVAAGAGIGGALLFAMFPGPVIAAAARDDVPAARPDPPNAFDRCSVAMFRRILRRPGIAFSIGAALVLFGALATPSLRFESDLRRLQVRDTAVDAAQASVAGTWGDVFSQQWIVVPGPDVETVLARTDAVAAALAPLAGHEFSGVSSTSAVMPAAATQRRRFEAWRAFWSPERRTQVRADLTASATEFGIRPRTFDPFLASIDTAPAPLTPERIAGTPLQSIVDRHLSVRPGDVLGLVVVSGTRSSEVGSAGDGPVGAAPAATWPLVVRDAVPEARVMSGRALADAIVGATRREFAILALPALAIVWVLLAAYWRSTALATVGVLPLVGGLLVAAALLAVTGERLTMLNAAVALPVFGLGVDYAIFLIDAIRGATRDSASNAAGVSVCDTAARIEDVGMRMGTMIGDVLTTLAGAIAMLLAATPAIRSIGLTMTAGVGGAVVVAWLMVPQAMAWAAPARARAAA